jgi:hypothetical protein
VKFHFNPLTHPDIECLFKLEHFNFLSFSVISSVVSHKLSNFSVIPPTKNKPRNIFVDMYLV